MKLALIHWAERTEAAAQVREAAEEQYGAAQDDYEEEILLQRPCNELVPLLRVDHNFIWDVLEVDDANVCCEITRMNSEERRCLCDVDVFAMLDRMADPLN